MHRAGQRPMRHLKNVLSNRASDLLLPRGMPGFFEWKAIKGQRAKQPYAIAMKDGSPFGIAGIWENWKEPNSGEWIRTFAIITTDANELVAEIHDRMPVILPASGYVRWLGEEEDPRELMRPFPSEAMRSGLSRRASTSQRTMIRRSLMRSCSELIRTLFALPGSREPTSIFLRRRRTILIDKPYPKWQS